MSRICHLCGKKPIAGRSIARRGLAKKKGGVGKKVTGITKRYFIPNLQSVKINRQGTVKKVRICTSCLKNPDIIKA
ncbi:50S ribosomal protein L28 [Chlamydiota bacterium]